MDDSLVVLVGDHGTSFQAGQPRKAINRATAADVAYVPLFVKAPEQEAGETVDETVSTLDVLPTIADHLGIELPWDVPGVSLAGGAPRDLETVQLNAGGGPLRIPADELEAERDERLARQSGLFGRGWDDLYRFGEQPESIGAGFGENLEAIPESAVTLDEQDWVATKTRVPRVRPQGRSRATSTS